MYQKDLKESLHSLEHGGDIEQVIVQKKVKHDKITWN